MDYKRGDIFMADLSPVYGSEQGGVRPVLIVQNDIGNKYSPTVIVTAITSKVHKVNLPTHIYISAMLNILEKDSIILCEQIRTIDKNRLKEYVGTLGNELLAQVDEALKISLNILN